MKMMPKKIQSFLDQIKELENASSEEREKAVMLLAEALDDRKIYILKKKKDVHDAADDIKAARSRLEDIHQRLDMSLKSGLASESIH